MLHYIGGLVGRACVRDPRNSRIAQLTHGKRILASFQSKYFRGIVYKHEPKKSMPDIGSRCVGVIGIDLRF